MAQSDSASDGRAQTKQARLSNPSGWLYLTQHDSVPLLVDALLDWPPDREFTVQEFATHAGLVRQTVSKHLDILIDVGLIEVIPETHPQRYRLQESAVTKELFAFNSAINAAAE
ncbi:winged helix-turn-helix domain-containing protein [Halocatena pleomorpha]|uniref:ArsR family transcriptional regulator n=1 Tax=Halocatena pleomorpha TaxID=1785090 RepID=A0A3P3RMA9_9EURY|nr:winged helix-turn-helix domain-containing protein [Halocatena pleomorpha]RRJ33533.1 ArsR family transcriptional regulator [Halocatena pleomorpha]